MAELYPFIKHIHLTSVSISILFFIVRGGAMLVDAAWLQRKLVRILPHIIDTLLLLSAILLMVILQQYPLQQGWLTAKVIGLFCYIGFGTVALKRGKTKGVRIVALLLALASVAYIMSVAITRNPMPW